MAEVAAEAAEQAAATAAEATAAEEVAPNELWGEVTSEDEAAADHNQRW